MNIHPLVLVLIGAWVAMTLVWWLAKRTRNAGYVDVAWSYLMGAAAVFYALTGEGPMLPRLLVGALAAFWGLRLGTHLLRRVHGEAEDGRYAYMRQAIGDHQGKWYAFFVFQAGLTVLFSVPFWVVAQNPESHLNGWYVAGAIVWVVSVAGESIADGQLASFRHDPANKGQVCDVGLWRYSRHPNYFFEWLHWFTYVLLAIGAPHAWLTWFGPALMLTSLLWVTGIPFVEAQSLRSRGERYRQYQARTSMFIPWFSKSAG